MLDNQKPEFSKVLDSVMEIFRHAPTPTAKKMWWSLLAKYPMEDVRNAFAVFLATGEFPPVPANIIKILNTRLNDKPRFQHTRRGWEKYDDEYGWYVVHESEVPDDEKSRLLRESAIQNQDCLSNTRQEAIGSP